MISQQTAILNSRVSANVLDKYNTINSSKEAKNTTALRGDNLQ